MKNLTCRKSFTRDEDEIIIQEMGDEKMSTETVIILISRLKASRDFHILTIQNIFGNSMFLELQNLFELIVSGSLALDCCTLRWTTE